MHIKIVRVLVTVLYAVFHPLKVTGRENIPSEGAYILALNHTSVWDAFTAFLLTTNEARYMAKKELFRVAPLRWFIIKAGAFPVDRENNDLNAMRAALTALKEGRPLVIFPEGHRYKDGQIHELKGGTAFVAMRSGAPLIPVRVRASYRPFRRVRVNVGKPILTAGPVNSKALEDTTLSLKRALESL